MQENQMKILGLASEELFKKKAAYHKIQEKKIHQEQPGAIDETFKRYMIESLK